MYTIALCEDNPVEARQICTLIKTILPDCDIHVFNKGSNLLNSAQNDAFPFPIVIMDIELGEESGLDIANQIAVHFPYTQIIFLTNYLDYATEVYEIRHVYFIHKPKMHLYLPKALQKARQILSESEKQFLHFTYQKQNYQLHLQDIRYMERTLRTTVIYTGNQKYFTSENFAALQPRLPDYFMICHRSYMINLHYVTKLGRSGIELDGMISVPVGKNYGELKQRYALYMTSTDLQL